jgi:hypothetical protein
MNVTVQNGANSTPVHQLTGEVPGIGPLATAHTIPPGHDATTTFHDTAGPVGQIPKDEDPEVWAASLAETVTIRFEMNGLRWTRTGNNTPATRIS